MFKQSSPRLARHLTRRSLLKRGAPLARTERRRLRASEREPSTVQPADGSFNIDQLLEALPKLPAHQQDVVRSLLNNQGPAKVDKLLKESYHMVGSKQGPTEQRKISAGGRINLRNKLIYDPETSLETLQEYFPLVLQNPTAFDKLFWKSVVQFYKITRAQGAKVSEESPPPYQFFGELFEVAKLQTNTRIRYSCIKIVGDILYSYNTVRMDPFNEVEYMDSLSYFGNSYRAIQIWKSRRTKKDVEGSLYWLEVGILYHQQAKLLAKAEGLAEEMIQEFGYMQPRVIIGFINSYGPTGNSQLIDKWVNQLTRVIELNNFKLANEKLSEEAEDRIDAERASALFNQIKAPSASDLEKVVALLLKNQLWSQTAVLIEYMEKCGMKNSAHRMLQVLDSTTRRLVNEVNTPKTLIPKQFRRSRRLAAPETNRQLMVVISKIISVYPEVLEYPKFYEAWLRGLTGLELYDNAITVLEAMIDRGIKPTPQHIMSLTRSLLGKNKIEIALELLARLEESSSEFSPAPTSSLYGLFISYGARRSDHELVSGIITRMYSQGLDQSPQTFNALLFYYYRHKDFDSLFKLLERVKGLKGFDLSHANYRSIWMILRDYYNLFSLKALAVNGQTMPPNIRELFIQMVQSGNFRLSMNVFEYVLQTFLLAGDYEGAVAILCFMDTITNIKIPGVITVSVLQLASKIHQKTTYAFSRPSRNELIVEPGYEAETAFSWEMVANKVCETLEIDGQSTISAAKLFVEKIEAPNEYNRLSAADGS
ncbi:Sov1p [Sugiyamaella lignohabitans]|uniref:Sov1p n=1 Tax=Sugiyamaella lignohabitans TaxID=796027 RepID=A0A161HM70_9ASCO|nr:Sov1p [Sugiyamaella lignohabitans]ANB14687.1 Sov1p [Sugiyamaella lignohabitans]